MADTTTKEFRVTRLEIGIQLLRLVGAGFSYISFSKKNRVHLPDIKGCVRYSMTLRNLFIILG